MANTPSSNPTSSAGASAASAPQHASLTLPSVISLVDRVRQNSSLRESSELIWKGIAKIIQDHKADADTLTKLAHDLANGSRALYGAVINETPVADHPEVQK